LLMASWKLTPLFSLDDALVAINPDSRL